MKYCEDCKYFFPDTSFHQKETQFEFAKCLRTGTISKTIPIDARSCTTERTSMYILDTCGREGFYWEKK